MKNENMLKILFLVLNILNLIYIDKKYNFIITLILIIFYYKFSKFKKKTIVILIWIIFSINMLFGESLFIHKSGDLTYTDPDIYNVHSWLLTAYANMVFCILLIKSFLNDFLTLY